jgi:D-alanine-D-alanine ligase
LDLGFAPCYARVMERVFLLFGGRSTEHVISIRSARYIVDNIDRKKYTLEYVHITPDGQWQKWDSFENPSSKDHFSPWDVPTSAIVFPMLHGTYGEDGSIQGLLDLLSIAYVGCDTTASAICMDKCLTKTLAKSHGIPVLDWLEVSSSQNQDIDAIKRKLGWPVFVKPTRLGSAVGAHKVTTEAGLESALKDALSYDETALIEPAIDCRELELAALGGYEPDISTVGEVIVEGDTFYTYDAKYISQTSARTAIPAHLDEKDIELLQGYARTVYKALKLYGLSRIDFFQDKTTKKFYLNEVNTMPGFTSISQYPMLWEHAGYTPSDLITKLLQVAKHRHVQRMSLIRTFQNEAKRSIDP